MTHTPFLSNTETKTLATNGDDRQDLDVLVTPVHKTSFAEDPLCRPKPYVGLRLDSGQARQVVAINYLAVCPDSPC